MHFSDALSFFIYFYLFSFFCSEYAARNREEVAPILIAVAPPKTVVYMTGELLPGKVPR